MGKHGHDVSPKLQGTRANPYENDRMKTVTHCYKQARTSGKIHSSGVRIWHETTPSMGSVPDRWSA